MAHRDPFANRAVAAKQPVLAVVSLNRIGAHPAKRPFRDPPHANRSSLASRPAQGVTPAGESGPSRPPRPTGILFGESPHQANRRQWRIGPPSESPPQVNRRSSVESVPQHAGARRVAPRWRIGTIAATEASRDPFRRIGPSGKSTQMANRRPSSESAPQHAGARRVAPRWRIGRRRDGRIRPRAASRRGPCGSGSDGLFGTAPSKKLWHLLDLRERMPQEFVRERSSARVRH